MNVFITGATGFLGTELVKRLVGEGHDVFLLIRNENKGTRLLENLCVEHRSKVNLIKGNLTSHQLGVRSTQLNKLRNNIDVFFHTAAFLSFDETLREEIFHANVEGTKNVLNFASLIGCKKFIHVSTAYTLGNRTIGKEELYPLNSEFINSYEESKCHAEHLVMSYANCFDVSIMRPAIVIGDSITGQANTSFGLYGILKAIKLIKRRSLREGKDINVRLMINQETVSHLVPVDYVITALIQGMHYSKKNTIYHVTNPNPPTNELVVNVIKNVLEYDSIKLATEVEAPTLTDYEKIINKSLHVFKDYLNRSIEFKDNNLKALFNEQGRSLLNMDEAMLYRIISGYENKMLVTK